MKKGKNRKLIVIGLDGADWKIINKLISEKKLPNFKKLIDKGSFGNLKSTLPTSSPPAWTSFITGKNPGKHGIFDFLKFDKKSNEISVTTSTDRNAKGMWSYLNNKKSIVINIPLTYPPEKINGFMISGMPNPEDNSRYCYPKNIYYELKKGFSDNIKIQPNIHYPKNSGKRFVEDQKRCWENNEKIFWYFKNKKEWDLLISVFHVFDELCHELWKYIDKEKSGFSKNNLGDNIFEMYIKADRFLGELIKNIDKNTTLFVLSDHGFGPVYKTIYLNNWLIEKGYLRLKNNFFTKIRKRLHDCGFNSYNLLSFIRKIGINPLNKAYKVVFRSDFKSPMEFISEKIFLSTNDIDWEKSIAFSMGEFGQIYIKKENVEDYEKFLKKLTKELKNLKDTQTGKKIFDNVFTKKELYKGKCIDDAPDVIFYDKPMHYLPVKKFEFGSNKLTTTQALGRSGGHKLYGVFLSYGKDIKSNFKKDLKIIDIAPTILYLLNEKIPESMDGKVATDIISEKFVNKNNINYIKENSERKRKDFIDEKDKKIIRERLEKLGYM